jgi:hypothetical protein
LRSASASEWLKQKSVGCFGDLARRLAGADGKNRRLVLARSCAISSAPLRPGICASIRITPGLQDSSWRASRRSHVAAVRGMHIEAGHRQQRSGHFAADQVVIEQQNVGKIALGSKKFET